MSPVSGRCTRVSRAVRGLRPSSNRNGEMRPEMSGLGRVALIQQAMGTNSSHRSGECLHSSDRVFWMHAPVRSTPPCPRGWLAGPWVRVIVSRRQRCWTMSAMNSLPASLQMAVGGAKVRNRVSRRDATLAASLLARGKAVRYREALSTTRRMYRLPARVTLFMSVISISSTSQGCRSLGGNMAVR